MEPTLGDVVGVLDRLYDPAWAESWDAVGLVTGELEAPVRRILFAVDPMRVVVDEAIGGGFDLLVTHHPLLLRGVNSVAATTPKGKVIHDLIRAGTALHVCHTNADNANPGVSDALAAALGLTDTTPLKAMPAAPMDKIVVYVPIDQTQAMIDALADAGAGRIGDYDRAAWSSTGEGTFRPLDGANPTIGRHGEIERVPESRVEMVMPRSRRRAVVAALKAEHSYEEPAFDVFETASLPSDLGGGRIGVLAEPVKLRDFAALVEKALPRTEHGVRVSGDLERTVERVAVVGGAGDSEFDRVRAAGVDAYVTADLRHHPATEARAYDEGPALVDVAHWASEWPWLRDAERLLKVGLAEQGSTVDTHISTLCTDAWTLRL
ncbi:dinuclear metal center YbgI/SA1388 family protein [Kribbella orskensis]|uniref:GTP cyclohydrolase 1 type 2 homolog n=1 Tax=Kribbella orskensis TaxID=2512216 RepID=A0ABY2BTR0_9ACTN|nr:MULTISPECIES: Nif3-like dinuclear metal center hexameric protein [Kribbella]TCN42648.1 dinuclear metal center YbgI/SA1388 family protein [Kribbella sp. VKM Ac-2500]TCO29996.1 dinuclear metal center YbgI/SA1388 family protein [Kribbella orskensis]